MQGQLDDLPGDADVARDELIAEIQQLEGLLAAQDGTTQVIEPASPAGGPISPNPRRNTMLGLIFAVLLAAGLVPLADRINRKLRSVDELEEVTGNQLLAQIPEAAFPGQPPSPAARESFQTLRAALRYFNLDQDLKTVLITSATHAEGKTTVATNLAVALARDGEKVILVDADLRKPRAAVRVGAAGAYGIEAVLVDGVSIDDALEEVRDGEVSFQVLGSSRPATNPGMLLSSSRMEKLLSDLGERAEIVVIDTPPILAVSDAIPLLANVSGVVLVARVNQSSIEAIRRTQEVVESARGRTLGVVATGTKGAGLYGGYGDYGEYGDSATPAGAEEPPAVAVTPAVVAPTSNGHGSTGSRDGASRRSVARGRLVSGPRSRPRGASLLGRQPVDRRPLDPAVRQLDPLLRQFRVQAGDVVEQPLDRVAADHMRADRGAHLSSPSLVARQGGDGGGERLHISLGNDQPTPIGHDLANTADVGRDRRDPGRPGFDQRDRRALVVGADHREVGGCEGFRKLGPVAEPADPIGDPRRLGLPLESPARASVADDQQMQLGDALQRFGERLEQDVEPLDRHDPTDEDADDLVVLGARAPGAPVGAGRGRLGLN